MASLYVFRFFLFVHFVLIPLSAGYVNGKHHDDFKCPKSFDCGNLKSLHFPFTKSELQHCGFITVHGCDDDPSSSKAIQLEKKGKLLPLTHVVQQEKNNLIITVSDLELHRTCDKDFNCNIILPHSPLASFHTKHNVTHLYRCDKLYGHQINPPAGLVRHSCPDFDVFCYDSHLLHPPPPRPIDVDQTQNRFPDCSILQLPCKNLKYAKDFSSFSCGEMDIEVRVSDDCDACYNHKGGQCLVDYRNNNFYCGIGIRKSVVMPPTEKENRFLKMGFGLGLGGLLIVLIGCLIIIWRQRKQQNKHKHKHVSSNVQLQSANNDTESGMAYFGIPVFSYEELEDATDHFEHSRELGSGGFGTVYYGKLGDGREVAVKRLYDHNYRRIERFMNEVNILTRLRHQNLLSLYGCTSRHSRELLLVYEYIPNGTLSCHLDGELANRGLLPWPIRFKIAIETASALAYLHASDTIHRDVKTNNILLDNNFCVKVADFGLSRLFPNDVTHVSTAPQGTPGYVDPEYYQCYQLTSKSDVYSFGVVLIELISSLPAVDIKRNKDEINLANLAVKKIRGESAFGELVDPSLGFESDGEVRRMIVSVAELAFQCLQRDKDLRPSMDEVLEILRRIESGKEGQNRLEEVDIHGGDVNYGVSYSGPPPSPEYDEAILHI